MPSLFERIPDLNQARNITTQQAGILTQVVTLISEFSLEDINQANEALRSFSLPKVSDSMETLTTDLGNLTGKLPNSPSEIIGSVQEELVANQEGLSRVLERYSAIGSEIARFRALIPQTELLLNLINQVNPIIDKMMQVEELTLSSPEDFLSFLESALPTHLDMGQMPFLSDFRGILETIGLWISATPEELSNFIQGRIEAFCSQIGVPAESVIQETLEKFSLDIATPLVAAVEEGSSKLPGYLSGIKELDLTDANQLNLAKSKALDAQDALSSLCSQFGGLLTAAEKDLRGINVGSLGEELQQKLFSIQEAIRIENIENTMENIAVGVSTLLRGHHLEEASSELGRILQGIQSKLDIFDLSGIKEESLQIADELNAIIERVDEFQIQATVAIKNLFQEIDETIDRVNLASIKTNIQDALDRLQEEIVPLQNQLSSIILQFTQFLDTISNQIQEFSLDFVEQEIEAALLQIQDILGDPDLQATVKSVSDDLRSIAEKLDQITFEPSIDSVIMEIDEMKAELAKIDVSSLSDVLLAALKVAVEVLKKIRFDEEISDVLINEFQQIRDVPVGLIEALARRSRELLEQIEHFDPEELLLEQLSKPLDSLKENLKKIEPEVLLQPILSELEKIITEMQAFAPSQLVTELAEMQNQFLSALQPLSPEALVAPLNELLDHFNELIDQADFSVLVKDMEKYVEEGKAIFNSFPLSSVLSSAFEVDLNISAKMEQVDFEAIPHYLEELLNQFLSKLDQINTSGIQRAFDQLSSTLEKVDLRQFRSQFNEELSNYQSITNRVDLMPLITETTQGWRELKSHLNSVTPPEHLQSQYDGLLNLINSLNPVAKLSPLASGFDGIRQQLQRLGEELNRTLDALTTISETTLGQLKGSIPEEVNKESLKEIVREAFSTLLLDPLRKILQAIEEIMPDLKTLFVKIEGFLDSNEAKFSALFSPLSFLKPIETALDGLKARIRSMDLSFLTEELQDAFKTLEGKIQSLDVSELTSGLDEMYQSSLSNIHSTLSKQTVSDLNRIYTEGILSRVSQIDVKSIVEPLEAVFENIRSLAEVIDAEVLFRPMIEKMEELFDQLESGLARTSKAFGQMITAIPV